MKTKAMSIETMDRMVKLIQEDNPQWSVAKDVCCSQLAVYNLVQTKIIEWLKKKAYSYTMKDLQARKKKKTKGALKIDNVQEN